LIIENLQCEALDYKDDFELNC